MSLTTYPPEPKTKPNGNLNNSTNKDNSTNDTNVPSYPKQ